MSSKSMSDADLIKEKIDIVELVGNYVELKKAGRNFKGLCPFHSEKSPSFFVSPDRQTWHCFGACDEGGDAIAFYMKTEQVTFPEALKELAKKTGVKLENNFEHDKSWQEKNRLYEINHLASEYYHYLLTKHAIGKVAREYLASRAIDEKIMETFMLGYAPFGWRNLLPFLTKKGYTKEEIEKAGLIIQGSSGWYDRFRKRLIFTLTDHRGHIVGFSGRVLDKTTKEAKYINSPETPLYHKSRLLYGLNITHEEIRKQDAVIICEGEFDMLSSFKNSISNIVAIKGTALTLEQLTILKRYTGTIFFALDMDVAGDRASHRSIELAEEMDFNIKVVTLTNGKDLDEALQNNVLEVKKAISSAQPVYDYILTSALKQFGSNEAVSKKNVASQVIPFYAKISNKIVQEHFIKRLAQELGVSEEAVIEQVRAEEKKKYLMPLKQTGQLPNGSKKKTYQTLLEEHLLSLLVQNENTMEEHLKKLDKTITIAELESPAVRRVIFLLLSKKPIPEELSDTYNRAYLTDIQTIIADRKTAEYEFFVTLYNIKKNVLRRKLTELATKLKSSDENVELNQQLQQIKKELKELEQPSKL
jgi:DNA primase